MSEAECLKIFSNHYEMFISSCDAAEAKGLWDKYEYGEMEAYFANVFVTVIIRLAAANGEITEAETEMLNEMLGSEYTEDELKTIYDDAGDMMDDLYGNYLKEDIELLKKTAPGLDEHFCRLLVEACDLLSNADGLDNVEKEMIEDLKEKLD